MGELIAVDSITISPINELKEVTKFYLLSLGRLNDATEEDAEGTDILKMFTSGKYNRNNYKPGENGWLTNIPDKDSKISSTAPDGADDSAKYETDLNLFIYCIDFYEYNDYTMCSNPYVYIDENKINTIQNSIDNEIGYVFDEINALANKKTNVLISDVLFKANDLQNNLSAVLRYENTSDGNERLCFGRSDNYTAIDSDSFDVWQTKDDELNICMSAGVIDKDRLIGSDKTKDGVGISLGPFGQSYSIIFDENDGLYFKPTF